MNLHNAPLPRNVDIELPLSDEIAYRDLDSTLGSVAGRVGGFAPTLSQVAAYPHGAGLHPQDFLRMSA